MITQLVVVTAIIIQDNKVLLQKRSDDIDTHYERWTTPSGKVEINEHPQDAVIREVKEELGIDVKVITPIPAIDSFPNHKKKYHLIYLSYLCEIIKGVAQHIDRGGEVSAIKWAGIDKLHTLPLVRGTLPPIKAALLHSCDITI